MSKIQKDFGKIVKSEDALVQQIVDTENELRKLNNNLNEVRIQKVDKGLQYYSKEKREEIIKKANSLGFSAQDISTMQRFEGNDHWNQDEVVIDIIDLFYKAEQFIDNNEYKSPLIVRIIEHLGDLSNNEDKRGDEQ